MALLIVAHVIKGVSTSYYVNDDIRDEKLFDEQIYFQLDNFWIELSRKRINSGQGVITKENFTFQDFQVKNAERSIAGWVDGHPCTFPDECMRAIYARLFFNPNGCIRKAFGTGRGHCAPITLYLHKRIWYLGSESASKALQKKLKLALTEETLTKRNKESKP